MALETPDQKLKREAFEKAQEAYNNINLFNTAGVDIQSAKDALATAQNDYATAIGITGTTPGAATSTTIDPTMLAMYARSGLRPADLAGLTNQTMRLNYPMAAIGLASTLPSFYQAYEQGKELKRLKKEGAKDVTPQAFRDYQNLVEQQSASTRMPGEAIARDEISRQQAVAQSNIERTAQNPAQALRAAMAANQQAIGARNQLSMQGLRDQARRRAIANDAMMRRAQFQEQGRREYANTLGALEAAKMQNINKGVQGGLSGLLNSFVLAPK